MDWYLHRQAVTGIVLAGLMTNFGVESTARPVGDPAYGLVFAEDAMATISASAHAFAVEMIFPLLGTVAAIEAIVAALSGDASGG